MKLIFPLFLLPLFFSFTIIIHADITLITSTCNSSMHNDPNINFDFCTASLQSEPESLNATLTELGAISIKLIQYNLTDTCNEIKKLLDNKKLDPYVRMCLIDCAELYSESIDSVNQGWDWYQDNKFDDANVEISSIMEDASTCEDGFMDEGVVSPVSKRNNDAFQLSAISLSIMKFIQNGSSV